MSPILAKILDFGLTFFLTQIEKKLEKETKEESSKVEVETPKTPVRPKLDEDVIPDVVYRYPLRFGDGRGGLLYKLSETRNAEPVVLLPGGFIADSVKIQGVRGTFEFAKGDFANPESNGVLRQHWRSGKSVGEIEKIVGKKAPYFLVVSEEDSGKITRLRLNSLRERVD
jgi:hypothetical protein